MPSILIFGKNGQVGYELVRTLSTLGDIAAVDIEDCDLSDSGAIVKILDANSPKIIVNAAAYTAVDKAESEPDIAHKINAAAPSVMSKWAAKNGALMVHYSTDYVFDGGKTTPWTEEDIPNPLSVYGRTKLEGDMAIQDSGCEYLIFRTSWVYGARGKNFYLTMRKLIAERDEVRVVDDQIGAPTWSRAIAEATAQVLAQKNLSGIYNMTNAGSTSWFGFAEAIKDEMSKEAASPKLAEIIPIPTSEYPTPAKRPLYSCLDCGKLFKTFGVRLPEWRESLRMVKDG